MIIREEPMNTNEHSRPVVSVIIPTFNRPELVGRAVASALAQTVTNIEVIVVIDGEYETTARRLEGFKDRRLVTVSSGGVGGGGARNAGISRAQGCWIALLDDDDEWTSNKLERQLSAATTSSARFPLVFCAVTKITPLGRYRWPRRGPRQDEDISEYLFTRRGLFQGEGYIPTPSIMVPSGLFDAVKFDETLERHQDWDWVLRATKKHGALPVFLDEQLCIVYGEEDRPSISSARDWEYSYRWVSERADLLTRRARASFLLTVVSALAAPSRSWVVFWRILRTAYETGQPGCYDLAIHFGLWLVPRETRRKLRARLSESALRMRE